MKKFFLIIPFLVCQFAFGQISNVDMNGSPARLIAYNGIEGSPYLFDDWSKAKIGTTNAGLKENISYKFNIHDNELEVISETGNKINLSKEYVEYAILERPSILIADNSSGLLPQLLLKKGFGFVKGLEDNDFVNVISEGKNYTLIRKFYADLVTPPKNSYAPTPGRMFVFEETFFLIVPNDEYVQVKNRTNSILKVLQIKDQEKAKEIIKEGKLDLSREDHLVIFFSKLNEE